MKKTLLLLGAFALASISNAQIFSEDFESGTLPTGWAQTTVANDGGWLFGTSSAIGSQYFSFSGNNSKFAGTNDDKCNCDKSDDFLYTTAVDLTGQSGAVFMSFKQYYFNASYGGAQEKGTIEFSTDGGATWSIGFQLIGRSAWATATYDISSFAGQNVLIGFRYHDGGGWTYGLGLDDISVFVPDNEDVTLAALELPNYAKLSAGAVDVKGTILNNAGVAITSLDVEYTINGGSPVSCSLTGLNVSPLTSYDFTHTTPWAPTANGSFAMEVKITGINGSIDSDITDNKLTQGIVVYTNSYPRVVLYEMFTSSTCPPCVQGNINFENIVGQIPGNEFASVKYQMNWPAPGDPYYNDAGSARKGYYSVSSVPNLEIDGGWGQNSGSFTMAHHTAAIEVPAFVQIDAEYSLNGKTIRACATITAMQDLGDADLQFTIIEGKTTQNTGSNGETEFFHVVKKMVPDASGQNVTITNGMNTKICEEFTFQGEYRLPNSASDKINDAMEHSVEEFTDLQVVVWLEKNKEIFNAANATSGITSVKSVAVNSNNFVIYPNPATTTATLNVTATQNTVANIKVMDLVGKTIFTNSVSVNNGTNNIMLNTSNYNSGVYIVEVTMNGTSSTKRLVIQK